MGGIKKPHRSVEPNGKRVRTLRKKAGLAVEDLAANAGVSERTVRNIEAGQPVHIRTLNLVANALGVDVKRIQVHELLEMSSWDKSKRDHDFFLEYFRWSVEPKGLTHRLIMRFNLAANHTVAYCARIKAGEVRDLDKELQLSDLWLLVAEPMLEIEPSFAKDVLWKANYWSDVDCWSDEDIAEAGIKLEPFIEEMRSRIAQIEAEERRGDPT